MPEMACTTGDEEAARRYRAIVITTLRQLKGLRDTRLHLTFSPEDAGEAIRFWLLPRLSDHWQSDGRIDQTDGWQIVFGSPSPSDGYDTIAHGEILCPFLGARWVHAAMLGLERATHQVMGKSVDGAEYFRARSIHAAADISERLLPELPVIRNDVQWNEALNSPLGPALQKAWEAEA